MPQSNVIFGFFFAAFVIFITTRGELPKYAAIFFGSSGAGGNGGGATGAPASNVPAPNTLAGAAGNLDKIIKTTTGGKLGLFGGPITDLGNKFLDYVDGK